MSTELATTKNTKNWSKRSALKFLGLPFATRWQDAEPILKDRMAMARRANDMERATTLSGVKAFLKRHLYRTCLTEGCGAAVNGIHRNCRMHRKIDFAAKTPKIKLEAGQ